LYHVTLFDASGRAYVTSKNPKFGDSFRIASPRLGRKSFLCENFGQVCPKPYGSCKPHQVKEIQEGIRTLGDPAVELNMKVILFGATGMVGQGVLRECPRDPRVETTLSVGRRSTGQRHDKLDEILQPDAADLLPVQDRLSGYDACFFCLGVSSVGMKPDDYRRLTYHLTLSVARLLAAQNPAMTFIYVSGTGTDSSERGRARWARVKGETENALLRLPFRAAYMFRPGYIQPLDGITPKTRWTRVLYKAAAPFYPALKALFPKYVTTTRQLGCAMIQVAAQGFPKRVLESSDIASVRCPG